MSDAGSNQIVIVAGANLQLNIVDIQDARNDVESASVVVCQLETPASVAIASAEMSKGVRNDFVQVLIENTICLKLFKFEIFLMFLVILK